MDLDNKFIVGEIVTFKTHPLLYDFRIKGDGKYVPPLMIVKEVFFENNKKIVVDEVTGNVIAERIKYTCIYFDANRSEFKEVAIYESMLVSFKKLFIGRIEGNKNDKKDDYESLRAEVSRYKNIKYQFSKMVYFKTKKLEVFKKRNSKKINIKEGKKIEEMNIQYIVNYVTPDFVLCGFKDEKQEGLFYPNGNKKKLVSNTLI